MVTRGKITKTSTRKSMKTAPVLNFDPAIVKKVQSQMLDSELLISISDFFKVLGDETRMKIIYALSHEELCVTDLAAALEMTQSAVSHQLKLLRMANQVKSRQDQPGIP